VDESAMSCEWREGQIGDEESPRTEGEEGRRESLNEREVGSSKLVGTSRGSVGERNWQRWSVGRIEEELYRRRRGRERNASERSGKAEKEQKEGTRRN